MNSFFQASQSLLASVRAAIWPLGETGAEPPAADAGDPLLRDVLIAPALSGADDPRVRDALAVVAAAAALGASSPSLDPGKIEEVRAAAITAERQRCSDVLRSDAAKGRLSLALHAAFATNMPAAECVAIIAAAPLEQAATPDADALAALSPLDRHMARAGLTTTPVSQPKRPARIDMAGIYEARAAGMTAEQGPKDNVTQLRRPDPSHPAE